jgi:hypothetical protein
MMRVRSRKKARRKARLFVVLNHFVDQIRFAFFMLNQESAAMIT